MGFKDKAQNFASKMKLDSHHAIERFGIMFAAVAVSGALLLGGATTSALQNNAATLDATVLYTPSFTTSKTQLQGSVPGVYTSTDGKRAVVLMQFKDSSSISANASNYQSFLTGTTRDLGQESPKTEVSGEIVVFGNTGYMAVVLDSDRPFEQQLLNLVIRSNSELAYKPGDQREIREDLKSDASFTKNDQWQVVFNPGASAVVDASSLDAEVFDPGAFFADVVIAPEEQVVRARMDGELGQMQVDLARIAEATEQAASAQSSDGVRLVLPDVPEQIAGDEVTGEEGQAPADTNGLTDEEILAATVDTSTLALKTDWVNPKGFDFDWRSGSVAEGYLDSIVPDDMTYSAYLASKTGEGQDEDARSSLRISDLLWELTDGTILAGPGGASDYRSNDTTVKPLNDARNSLAQAYQDYYTHKSDYQIKSFSELIELELELRNVRTGSSVNDSPEALLVY